MAYQSKLKYGLQWGSAILLGLVTVVSIAAEQDQGVKGSQAGTSAIKMSDFTYKPLLLDAPRTRIDGSTRGTDGETVILQVLAPEHTGLTLQAQPTLYWYTRTTMATRFEIARIDKDKTRPLLAVEADSEKDAGIQQLDLGDHNISLQPEVSYQWSVTQVIDKGSQSTDVIASGMIERIETGEGLSSRIKMSHGTDLVAVYASEGIWYDALETISSMLEKSPADQGLPAIRASLLEQVGLEAATGN